MGTHIQYNESRIIDEGHLEYFYIYYIANVSIDIPPKADGPAAPRCPLATWRSHCSPWATSP